MTDPFRDDRDALVARNAALTDDVERLEKERTELAAQLAVAEQKAARYDAQHDKAAKAERRARAKAAKLEEINAKQKDPTKRRSPSEADQARSGRTALITMIGIGGVVAAFVIVPSCRQKREHAAWVVASDHRKSELARWSAYTAFGTCLRQTEATLAHVGKLDVETGDPRTAKVDLGERMFDDCGTSVLALDDAQSPAARAAFARWVASVGAVTTALGTLAPYLEKGDWKDDNYASGPAKWAPFVTARDAFALAVHAAREAGLPSVNAAIAGVEAKATPGSSVAWTIRLGGEVDAIDDAVLTKNGRARELAKQLLDDARLAPIEVRRVVRSISGLEDLAKPDGYISAPDNYALWGSLRDEHAPFPDPGREPDDGGCSDNGGD